jgi:hypothetical protein
MSVLLASAADAFGGSSGILGFVLGGGLLTAVLGGYRFLVNFRVTERGMARDRVSQAVKAEQAERRARQRVAREASLWQARCADLEYLLRQQGVSIPALNAELYTLAFSANSLPEEAAPHRGNDEDDRPARGKRGHRARSYEDDDLDVADNRLRRQEKDERQNFRSLVSSGASEDDDTDEGTEQEGRE